MWGYKDLETEHGKEDKSQLRGCVYILHYIPRNAACFIVSELYRYVDRSLKFRSFYGNMTKLFFMCKSVKVGKNITKSCTYTRMLHLHH